MLYTSPEITKDTFEEYALTVDLSAVYKMKIEIHSTASYLSVAGKVEVPSVALGDPIISK